MTLGALPATFEVDGDRIEQVLQNLLRNAVLSAPPGSPIEVSVSVDTLGLRYMVRDLRTLYEKLRRYDMEG